MLTYIKFLITVLVVTVIGLNVVAYNFSRLTGIPLEKPVDVVIRKGDIYVSVLNKKTKVSSEEVQATLERYRNKIPNNEALFDEVKRWYNSTRNFIEKR